MSDSNFQTVEDGTTIFKEKLEQIKTSNVEVGTEQKNLVKQVESVIAILKKINEVAKSVALIAEKTQLISVNASIEAARSGVEGKSFSVIAQEIKSLAKESKDTVTHIETYTLDITKSIQKVLAVLKFDNKKLEEQTGELDSINDVMDAIVAQLAPAEQY